MIEYKNQLKDFEFDVEEHKSHHPNKKTGEYKITKYCNNIMTFDIEVTSAWLQDGKVIPYHTGETAEYWNNLEPLALPYIWQFSIDGTVYYGRELKDFEKVLKAIPKDLHCIVWVHNLYYEFAHLSDFLKWGSVFARSPHKPMKAKPKKYKNIEFRCSYTLTNLSLANWGKKIGLEKMVGDLDYEKLRTPLTELSEVELGYCERDCLVVEAGIKDFLKTYKKQRNIPLTSTGTIRREVKSFLCSEDYIKFIKKLVPRDVEEYNLLRKVFAGGYTHANRYYKGKTITDYIEHYDFASSYPAVMVSEKFAMTPWIYAGHSLPEEETFEDTAYIMTLKFHNIYCNTFNTYIQASKVSGKGMQYDNGRVIKAEELTITVLETDYLTIKESYRWESLEVLSVYKSYKDYLPKEFVEYILELYGNKTSLKDVEGMEDIYMQSKSFINGLFGMCVTAIIQADVKLNKEGQWYVEPLTSEDVNKKLDSLQKYNLRDKRYFLSYSWGCEVSSYARRNLWKCILHEDNDLDVMYCDTDSIFIIGEHSFDWYNKEITEKLRLACDSQGIDFSLTRPKTPKGVEKPLGIFSPEEPCSQFRSLGAKRYCERRATDGQLHLTVSGINKEAVKLLNDDIENFKDGFDFDKDSEYVSKRLHTYIYDMSEVTYPDGYVSKYTTGINMRRTGYELTMVEEYKALLEFGDLTVEELPERTLIKLRGEFYG